MQIVPCTDFIATQVASFDRQIAMLAKQQHRRWWFPDHRQIARKQDLLREREQWARGGRAEQHVAAYLRQWLPGGYYYLTGFHLPGQGDVDGVLIGPHGITVYEIKAYRGRFLVNNDQWYRLNSRKQWEPAQKNPTLQAEQGRQAVLRTLSNACVHGLPSSVPVYAAVILAGMFTSLDLPISSSIPVVLPARHTYTWSDWMGGAYYPDRPIVSVKERQVLAATLAFSSERDNRQAC